MIHIYYTYIAKEKHDNLIKNELFKFPIEFQEKIKKYRRWEDAQSSLIGRVLLLQGIAEQYNLDYVNKEICYTKFNKPYFSDDSIHFNISHSGDIVICAFSKENILGVDIEKISDINIPDFKSQFTLNEWTNITNSNESKKTFFDYWTKKEAVIKSHGEGLSIPLQSFEIIDNLTKINKETFYLKELEINIEYKCYLSMKKNYNKLIIKKL